MILFEYVNRVLAWSKSRDRGATAVEYALVLSAIVGALAVTLFFFGDNIQALTRQACQQVIGGTTACP